MVKIIYFYHVPKSRLWKISDISALTNQTTFKILFRVLLVDFLGELKSLEISQVMFIIFSRLYIFYLCPVGNPQSIYKWDY